jgi:prepilin-type N-terminal cleavage/methylation domain-containing protein
MKKLGQKGFTLIELLAVITIMGILLLVAIPAVSRTIENSRRDTFATVASEYLNAVRNAVLADNVECYTASRWTIASAIPDGTYYFPICTSASSCLDSKASDPGKFDKTAIVSSTKELMESGGRSSFGNAELEGYVTWTKTTSNTDPNNPKTTTTYKILLNDTGKHGFNGEKEASDLKRANVLTNLGSVQSNVKTGSTYCKVR